MKWSPQGPGSPNGFPIFFPPEPSACSIFQEQHQPKPGEVESSSIEMVSGFLAQSGPTSALIPHAQGRPAGRTSPTATPRPLSGFRLQSSDTSPGAAGLVRTEDRAGPQGGADALLPDPASAGNRPSRCSLGYLARVSERSPRRDVERSPRFPLREQKGILLACGCFPLGAIMSKG